MASRAERSASAARALKTIKVIHTGVWGFFVACILGIPICAAQGRYLGALALVGLVAVEVGVLAANAGQCPLTRVAARHTRERQANFDIYLPEWLAKYNQVIFGSLYVAAILYTVGRWATH